MKTTATQEERLAVEWYASLLRHSAAKISATHVITVSNRSCVINFPELVREALYTRMDGYGSEQGEAITKVPQDLLRYHPSWYLFEKGLDCKSMDSIRSGMREPFGMLEGLPMEHPIGGGSTTWKEKICNAVRYRNRGLSHPPVLISDIGTFRSDMLALCEKEGVPAQVYSTLDCTVSHNGNPTLEGACTRQNLMHLLAHPDHYVPDLRRVHSNYSLLARYVGGTEEDTDLALAKSMALALLKDPNPKTAVNNAVVIKASLQGDLPPGMLLGMLEAGIDKVRECLATYEYLTSSLPGLSDVYKHQAALGVISKESDLLKEALIIMKAAAEDPSTSSLVMDVSGKGAASHAWLPMMLRYSMEHGPEAGAKMYKLTEELVLNNKE